jgi:Fe2+ transport system protein FeoA
MSTVLSATGAVTSNLSQLPIGTAGRVLSIGGTNSVARRLMEMGVVPGAPVRVIKSAPLGGPLEIWVRGYHLALRVAEAQTITVSSEQ